MTATDGDSGGATRRRGAGRGGGGGGVGVVPGVGASVAAVEVVEAVAEVVEAATAVEEAAAAVVEVAAAVVLQLREWYAGRGRSVSAGPCTYVLRTGSRRGETCGLPHTEQRCFGHLTDAWRAQFPDVVELPRWHDLLRQNLAIFDLDFDAILAAMYALTDSAEGDCYLSVPPDPGIEAAALGASASAAPGTGESTAPGAGESALSGTAPTETLHTFTLDSGVSRSFFRNSTTLTPLSRPIAVSLADPSGAPVLAHSSTVLPCPAAPSGLLSGLHLPSFSMNLQPRVSLLETTPTLRWTGKVGDASAFHVWGSRAFFRDTSADKLSSRAAPCVFLGFPPDTPRWQFYHPTLHRVLSSQDVTFDESVSYYRVSQVDPAKPVEVAVHSGAAGGAEPERVESGGAEPERMEPGGAEPRGFPGFPLRREPLSPQRLREWYARRCRPATGAPGGAAGAGAAGGAAGAGATGVAAGAGAAGGAAGAGAFGGAAGAGAARGTAGARAAGGAAVAGATRGAAGAGAAGGAAGAGATGGAAGAGAARAAGPGGARTRGTGAAGAGGAAGVGAGGAARVVAGDPGAEGTGAVSAVSGGAARSRPYYVPLLQQVLGLPPSPGPTPPLLSPPPVQSQSPLQPSSPLPGPSPYSGPTRGLTGRREPESHHVSPVSRSASPIRTARTGRRTPRPPPVPCTHSMTLRPSTAPQRVPLPSPPASSLPNGPDLESDSLRAASPTVTHFLATPATNPLFESNAACALVAELVDFAAACRLYYATSLVAESASSSVCPPSVGGECALGTDVLDDRQEEFERFAAAVPHLVSMLLAREGDPDTSDIPTPHSYAEAIEDPYSSQWQAAMDAEMASWKSTSTYVDEVPPPGANIVSGMWIFRVKRPPGSPPVFKARYVARGFSQRQGVDFFQTFSPTPKMTTLWVLLHVAAHRHYELHSLDFSTAFLQGSLHEEIWLRRPPSFTGSFPVGTQWSLRQPVYGLRQAPREWHDTLRTTLAALGFAPSTADPSLFLRTDTTLPFSCCLMYLMTCTRPDLAYPLSLLARYVAPGRHRMVHCDAAKRVLRYLCSTSGMGLVLGGRARVVLTGHADASWVDDLATQQSSQGYTFSLGSGFVSWRSTRSSSVLSSSCEAEIYAGAMAAQELRWLTYLLTDLGEAPCSPPVLYVDNKAMLALCQEHRLEHRTKHIALRYFLARELQQRGQLRLAYVASQANTADVFTKALQPCDHQRFYTVLRLVPIVPHLLTS
ncbi:unnamed protein product [Closterium sp. NIES-53]